ncbi:hypothetical protein [Stutzerimonas nitrititolerans]|uniref:hypothetical protein n=1 Tax=Stutzerimonas nitrititolerans TaxID=2482751 RepID=UPI0028AC65EC|nr:hypothetical protein [Stutzerimonas nitrititolerans]
MAKFFALFNIIASAASIAGFFLAIQLANRNIWIAAAFAIAFLMCCYVLFVPSTKIENNVAGKLRHFRTHGGGSPSTEQTGEFSISAAGPTRIKFHTPFSSPPAVEAIHLPGKSGPLPTTLNVTVTGAEFRFHSYSTGSSRTFQWVAFGDALEPLEERSSDA